MSWSIFLLPLLGGYIFLTRSIQFQYFYKRTERQRLIFDSLIWGIGFFLVAFFACLSVKNLWPDWVRGFTSSLEISIPFFYQALLSLILSIALTFFKNRYDEPNSKWFLAGVIRETGSSFHQDCLTSYANNKPLMITLRGGKVYVGVICELNEPDPEHSFIRMLLIYSGYRDDKLDVQLISDYNRNDGKNITTTIRESEIITATFFDQDVYQNFQATS